MDTSGTSATKGPLSLWDTIAKGPLSLWKRAGVRALTLTAALALALTVMAGVRRAAGIEVDSAMFQDPKIEYPPPIPTFSPKLKPLWLEALAHPEADLQRQAAETMTRAHEMGMPGLDDAAGPLLKVLDAADQHPVVVLAAAGALVAIDARGAAPRLFEHAMSDGLDLAQLVEPALARWDYRPIRKVWLERLSAPRVPRRLLMLAIRGVEAVGQAEAEPGLLELALAPDVAPDIRMEAARALGKMRAEGLEDDARSLAADKSPAAIVDRLVSAWLLGSHRGQTAETLLLELAVDPEPSVAAIALARLLEIDPKLILSVIGQTIANDDANVRRLGARALVACPSPENVGLLGPMLDDRHPGVRGYVRESLLKLAADPSLADPVLQEGLKMLAADRWRGLEQATLLVVGLDHKPAVRRLVELLDFQRPEVFITAAWGLRRLAVPDVLDAMLDKVRRETERIETSPSYDANVARQLCQLLEAFGQMQYAQADPLLRRYIPKGAPFGQDPRAAAIWALGHIHAGKPQPDLSKLLSQRLADVNPMNPESDLVRRMSAVSLGRMKAEDALPTLRRFYQADGLYGDVGYACCWAIHQITGEPIPELETPKMSLMGWFLEPVE